MATPPQKLPRRHLRGSEAANNAYTGKPSEITFDGDHFRGHNGVIPGGRKLAYLDEIQSQQDGASSEEFATLQEQIDALQQEVDAIQVDSGSSVSTHHASHENGGDDEISVAGLSGLLADPQTPLAHAASHQNGGADEINVAGLSGLLADPQTPLAHKTSHENGGADEISVAGLSGLLADPQTPIPAGADDSVQFKDGTAQAGSTNVTIVGVTTAEVLTLLKNAQITNQKTAGTTAENPTKIITGGPNTKGLRVEGTELTTGTPWTPAQLSSSVLLLWLDLSQESGFVDGDPIGLWDDFSGNNNDGTASGVDRPTYETNEINTYPVTRYDGVNDRFLLNSTINLGTTDFNVIGVGTRSTSTRFIPAGHVAGGNYGGFLIWDDNFIYSSMDDGSAYSAPYTGTNGDILFHFRRSGTTHFFVGGGMAETTLPNTFGSSQSVSLRAVQESTVRSAFGVGDIAELIVLSSSATQSDWEKVRGYIAWKYGLQSQIPAGDPYESIRPEMATPAASNLVEIGQIAGETQVTVASRGQVTVSTHTATDVAMTLQAAAGQTTALQQFKNSSGTVLYEFLPVARQTYNISNVTTDRTVNANATTVDELADAFGTLVADLRAMGIIA